jgi:hypothetical protein
MYDSSRGPVTVSVASGTCSRASTATPMPLRASSRPTYARRPAHGRSSAGGNSSGRMPGEMTDAARAGWPARASTRSRSQALLNDHAPPAIRSTHVGSPVSRAAIRLAATGRELQGLSQASCAGP